MQEVMKHQYEWESPQKELPSHGTHFGDHAGMGALAEVAPYHIAAGGCPTWPHSSILCP